LNTTQPYANLNASYNRAHIPVNYSNI